MALRLSPWKRRLIGLSAGLLLSTTVGCRSTHETGKPKLMGSGNQTSANSPSSPAFKNLANNNPGFITKPVNTSVQTPAVVAAPTMTTPANSMSSVVTTTTSIPTSSSQQIPPMPSPAFQQQYVQPAANPQYAPPMMAPNGQQMASPHYSGPNYQAPNPQYYEQPPAPGQGMQQPQMQLQQVPTYQEQQMQGTPQMQMQQPQMQQPQMQVQPGVYYQGQPVQPQMMPMQPQIQPMGGVKVPDGLPPSVTGPSLLPASYSAPNLSLNPPPELKSPSARVVAEYPAKTRSEPEEVITAPITIGGK